MNSSSIHFQDLETESQYGLTADSVFIAWFIMIYFPDSWIFLRLFACMQLDVKDVGACKSSQSGGFRARWKDCAADGGSYTRKGGIAWDRGVEKNSSHFPRRLILDTHISKALNLIHRTPLLLRDSSPAGKAAVDLDLPYLDWYKPKSLSI